MIRRVGEGLGSVLCFLVVLGVLVSYDARVRTRVAMLVEDPTHGAISPLGDRLSDLGGVLWQAAREQSIENAPLLLFMTIGAVLVLFMLKT